MTVFFMVDHRAPFTVRARYPVCPASTIVIESFINCIINDLNTPRLKNTWTSRVESVEQSAARGFRMLYIIYYYEL